MWDVDAVEAVAEVPELTVQVARAVAARGPYPLAMRVRDELGELFADAAFAEAFEECLLLRFVSVHSL